ncbi:MAG: DHA2 family efflux MFS transporter permease subunit [Chloroflexi bacterium]|nr:DHA2 family efflux MFS transporter permease subunit [Chloroflexota bacterium]MBV9892601.1 DHA2 family efflux MFS transporter permease subunit [Chloroflexota bacterium]
MNPTQTLSAARQRWVLVLAAVSSLMVLLDVTVVVTALNTIRLQLNASIDQLEWTLNAFTLTFAVLLMSAAALGDRFGQRRMLVIGLGLFTFGSAACALAPSIGWLIAARAVQGTAAALVMPHAMALLSAAFPPQQRGRALGIFSSITGIALIGGPAFGGVVVQGLAWQWIFWFNVPIGLVLIPLILSRIQESARRTASLDFGGAALVSGGALGLVWGLIRANVDGWASVEVIAPLAAGVILLTSFVAWELRMRQPMLPMRYFRSRAFSAGNAAGFLLQASTFGAVFFFPQYLQTTLHYGPLDAGLRLVPWTANLFVVAPIAGSLVNRLGERQLVVPGLLLQAAALAAIGLIAHTGGGYSAMLVPLILAGVGASMAMPAQQNAVISSVPPASIGVAAGTLNTLRQLGGTFGVAILAAVFTGNGSYASAASFSDGFVAAIGAAALMALLGAIVGAGLPGRRSAAQTVLATAPVLAEAA